MDGIYFNLLTVLLVIISHAVGIASISMLTLFDFEIGTPQRKRAILMCSVQQNHMKTNQIILLLLA